MPPTANPSDKFGVPVKVGLEVPAFAFMVLVTVVAKSASSPNAAANSSSVLSKSGAPLVSAVIAEAFVAIPAKVVAILEKPGIATAPVKVGASLGALPATDVKTVSTLA